MNACYTETVRKIACMTQERRKSVRIEVAPEDTMAFGSVVLMCPVPTNPRRNQRKRPTWWYREHREAA